MTSVGAGLTPLSMASAEARTGGRLGLMRGSPQISQAVRAGWLWNVHRGQGNSPSDAICGVARGGGANVDGDGAGGLRVPGGGGIPQFKQGETADVVEKFEGYGFKKVQ